MTAEELKTLGELDAERLSPLLRAMWCDAQADWEKAHALAQDVPGSDGARVHAYLHRKQGDEWNAGYWYRQAGLPPFHGSLSDEWRELTTHLLKR